MLEFYEFNTFNICIVLSLTFICYYILSNFFKTDDKKDNDFNLEYLIIAIIISICISLTISYIMSGNDEAILTDNFWENNQLE